MPRLFISLIVLSILVALSWGGMVLLEQSKPRAERQPPREVGWVPVVVRQLESGPVSVEVSAFGTLTAGRAAHLGVETGGRIRERLEPWTVGQFVAAGTLLVGLDSTRLDPEVAAAEARLAEARASSRMSRLEREAAVSLLPLAEEDLALAEREERRLSELSEGSFISESQIDAASRARSAAATFLQNARAREGRAGAAIEVASEAERAAEANLDVARERRQLLELRAPFDGYLTQPGPAVGTYLLPGTPVATLVDTGDLRVVIEVPEEDFASIAVGNTASLRLPARPAEEFEGRVIGLGVEAHPRLRTLGVEIALGDGVGPPVPGSLESARLRPGQFVHVEVNTAHLADGLVLAREEIAWRAGRPTAFVMIEEEPRARVEARTLTLGARIGSGTLIEQGLSAGEVLITAPLGRLDGGEFCRRRDSED